MSWIRIERPGLIFAEQILDQVHAQFGEIGIELEAQIRLLRFLDLVDFVGGQEIALRQSAGPPAANKHE